MFRVDQLEDNANERHWFVRGSVSLRAESESVRQPVVLLATAERWTSTARLALALRSLGCELALVTPRDHPADVCGALRRHFRYDPLRPLQSLRRAVHEVDPVAILPADETIACHLGELWGQPEGREGEEHKALEALLTRSLGNPAQLCETGSRMGLQRAAEAEGIPTPATMEISEAGDLAAAFQRLGSPLVLKADASSGGRGVRTAATLAAAQQVYRRFSRAPRMPRAVLRGVLHRDWTHVRSSARRERHGVTAQAMVRGVERTAMAFAHRGKVLAVECFEVVHTWKLHGPSSVLRRVPDARMEAAIAALVRRLEITGFCGFDFIVDPASGVPLLLERNARPTQLAHLSFGAGHDLAAAYMRSVVGESGVKDRVGATERDLIALFPHELQRDANSRELREAFHDVPWESPALMQRALRGDAGLRAALANIPAPAAARVSHSGHTSGSFRVAGSAGV